MEATKHKMLRPDPRLDETTSRRRTVAGTHTPLEQVAHRNFARRPNFEAMRLDTTLIEPALVRNVTPRSRRLGGFVWAATQLACVLMLGCNQTGVDDAGTDAEPAPTVPSLVSLVQTQVDLKSCVGPGASFAFVHVRFLGGQPSEVVVRCGNEAYNRPCIVSLLKEVADPEERDGNLDLVLEPVLAEHTLKAVRVSTLRAALRRHKTIRCAEPPPGPMNIWAE